MTRSVKRNGGHGDGVSWEAEIAYWQSKPWQLSQSGLNTFVSAIRLGNVEIRNLVFFLINRGAKRIKFNFNRLCCNKTCDFFCIVLLFISASIQTMERSVSE